MKFKMLSIIGLVCAMMAVVSCGSDKSNGTKLKKDSKDKTLSIEFETHSFSIIAEDSNYEPSSIIEGSKYLLRTGKCVLPVKIGDANIEELRDTLLSLAEIELTPSGEAVPILDSNWKLTDLPDTTYSCNSRLNNLSVVLSTPDIIVWQALVRDYPCGAAHEMYSSRYINYSLRSNSIITLESIMKPGYESMLLELIREKLDGNEEIIADHIPMPSQFKVTPDGLTFVYGIYEIASFASGEIEVSFYLYELGELLSDQGMRLIE